MIRTFTLTYDEAPKSLNAGGTGSRQHWSKGHQEKRRWEGIYGMLLLEKRVPRGMEKVSVTIVLMFRHRNRRDVENYRSSVTKPLADCLHHGGWIPDDTAEFFEVGSCEIESGVDLGQSLAMSRVVIVLSATYPDAG